MTYLDRHLNSVDKKHGGGFSRIVTVRKFCFQDLRRRRFDKMGDWEARTRPLSWKTSTFQVNTMLVLSARTTQLQSFLSSIMLLKRLENHLQP